MRGSDPQRGRPWWPWLLGALLAGLVLGALVLVAARPWTGTAPATSPTSPPGLTPQPTGAPPVATSPAAPPGTDAVFDATTLPRLLLRRGDVASTVPAAEEGDLRQGVAPGATPWGLPTGGTVDPAGCTTAVTVVDTPPVAHDALAWTNDEVQVAQDVVLLPDPAAAREAFGTLVTAIDRCTDYTVRDASGATVRWVTQPAIEGQGRLPEVVQEVTVQEGDSEPRARYVGHTLVGNAVVTWMATALDPGARDRAADVLGTTDELSRMVEDRALAAARALR